MKTFISQDKRLLFSPMLEHRGLKSIASGMENMNIRIPSVDSFLKRKVCLCVFDCLLANVCTPFKNYFTRKESQLQHNEQTFIS